MTESHFPLNFDKIQSIIPHRYPFLFVDRVLHVTEKTKGNIVGRQCLAIKNVSGDEYFFSGHFPGMAVMPGVLIVEALAQASLLCISAMPDDPPLKEAFLAGIKEARFKKPVVPGDTLKLHVECSNTRGNFVWGNCKASVDGEVAVHCQLTSQVIFDRALGQ